MAIILTERSVALSITKVYQERLMKSAELVAKKELVSLSTAIDSAAVKGQDSLSFKLSTAITRLASQYKAVALNIIENDIRDAHYDVQVITDPKTNETIGYDIFWTEEEEEENPEPEDVDHASSIFAAMATRSNVAVRLTEDMQIEEPIVIESGKKLTIDLNSNDITTNMNGVLFQANGGELVINGSVGSEITSSAAIAQASNGGKVTINGGIYNMTSGKVATSAQGPNSELNITNGVFNTIEPAAMAEAGATLNITGGTFNSGDNFAIGTNGTKRENDDRGNNTINIDNCIINAAITTTGYEAVGIYVANNDIVNIGPNVVINVHNGCGICQRAGQVTIQRGAKIALTSDDPELTGWVGDNKRKLTQSGVIYAEADNYPGMLNPGDRPMKLVIEDGVKITGIAHAIEIISENETPNVTIGNGIYSPNYPE